MSARQKYPDETILAMRRLRDWEGKTATQIRQSFPEISLGYIKNVLTYSVRAELDPGPRPVQGAGA